MSGTSSSIEHPVPPGLSLRPIVEGDLPFLGELYASTRTEEMAVVPWSAAEKQAFLASQFEFQRRHYEEHYPGCEFLIVERAGEPSPIGRLYVDRWPDQIRVVDISLMPGARGQGLGTALLKGVLAEGAAAGLPVTIHVEHHNPARHLYERLEFQPVDSSGVYCLMKWSPGERP
jgi:GNAT superfamily N-acetyltransferase